MRITIEIPEELLTRARSQALSASVSLEQFLIDAIQQKLTKGEKVRRDPLTIDGPPMLNVTRQQIGEAMFG